MKTRYVCAAIGATLLAAAATSYFTRPVTFASRWNADLAELSKVDLPPSVREQLHLRALEIMRSMEVASDDDAVCVAAKGEHTTCKQEQAR